MIKIGGYKSSNGANLGITPFVSSPTLQNLAAPNINADEYIIPTTVPVFDQGQLSDCVANSTCMALQIINEKETGKVIELSRLFNYFNARNEDGTTGVDGGTFIHFAYNSLQLLGVSEESLWPYDPDNVNVQPNILSYKMGNSNKINSFYQITSSGQQRINDIVLALQSNTPISFGTIVGSNLESYNGDPNTVIDIPSDSLGGHAILIRGYKNKSSGIQFLVRNSWGAGYGINGEFWMSANYITWDQTQDLFVPTLVPNLLF
jgi:C1A family cysteine protease